jgi:ribosomal protein L11 methyltransferase
MILNRRPQPLDSQLVLGALFEEMQIRMGSINPGYMEIRIITSVDAGELLGMLEETACLGAWAIEDGFCLYWPVKDWDHTILHILRDALQRLGAVVDARTLTVAELQDQDWNARWAESIQPIMLGHRILIRQSWNAAAIPEGGFELIIDPKRAFGTGYHATTQLMAEWLEEKVRAGARVLDVGTGSGILAMAALRLGATSALAIDHDPEAIECAREYTVVNGFGEELELRVAELAELDREEFDLVLANLDRNTLVKNLDCFHRFVKSGGCLLISGLQRDDETEISESLEAAGWMVVDKRWRDEWLALELRAATDS